MRLRVGVGVSACVGVCVGVVSMRVCRYRRVCCIYIYIYIALAYVYVCPVSNHCGQQFGNNDLYSRNERVSTSKHRKANIT